MSTATGQDALPQAIAQQAVEWWLQLQEAPDSAAMRQQWQTWLGQSPLHEQAWQRVEAVQQRLQGVVDAPHKALAHAALAPRRALGRRHAVQALVLLVFGGGAAWQMESHLPWRNAWGSWVADVRTPRGERRRLTLDDGTQLVLQGGSALDVAYGHSERRLLLHGGEVYVTSAPDVLQPARPLLVQTTAGEMRALGTRFTVHSEEDGRSLVAVYEGAVRLEPRLAPALARVLPAGQQAWLDAHQVQAPEPAREESMAWVEGMLVARGMRLDAVLQALQPASTATLVCHPAAAALQVSGTYPLDDVPRVMQALGSLLHLEVRTLTRWWGGQEMSIGPVGAL